VICVTGWWRAEGTNVVIAGGTFGDTKGPENRASDSRW